MNDNLGYMGREHEMLYRKGKFRISLSAYESRAGFRNVLNVRPTRPYKFRAHIPKSIFLLPDTFLHHCPSLRRYCAVQEDQDHDSMKGCQRWTTIIFGGTLSHRSTSQNSGKWLRKVAGSSPGPLHVTTLGKSFTHMCLCHQAV